ncbi:MAG TPA: hypothetical protein VIK51_04345 [Vicinamibacteria bacterium]
MKTARFGMMAVAPLVATVALAADAPQTIAIRGARIVTVSGPVIENGTIVLAGGKIAAVGADAAVPAEAQVVDGAGRTVYPGLINGLTTLGLTEIGSVPGSVDTTETGDINPQARAWLAVQPHSELIPVARANGTTVVLTAPLGGLVSGQSALLRLAGSTPEAMSVKQPVAMHMVYPTGRPAFSLARLFEEPEPKTFEERVKDRRLGQEKELRRLGNLLEDARALGQRLSAGAHPDVDLPEEALAAVARGELPVVMRADGEDEIRGAVRFAGEHGLKLIIAGGLEAWRCADLLKEKGVPVLLSVDRPPAARVRPLRRRLHQSRRAPSRRRPLRDRERRRRGHPQPPLRGGDGTRPWPARGGRAACDHALAGRDLRRRGSDGRAHRGPGRKRVRGHRGHHGSPHAGHPRLRGRGGPIPGDSPHPAVPRVQGPAVARPYLLYRGKAAQPDRVMRSRPPM